MSLKKSRAVQSVMAFFKSVFKKKEREMDPATALALVLFILLLPVFFGAGIAKKKK